MEDHETRVCRLCGGDPKTKSEFYINRTADGKEYARTECRKCTDRTTRAYHRNNRDRHILNNCRKTDRRFGFECALTREDIRALISTECRYCGEADRLGVDRVDNSRGYSKDNIVPCCIRCNSMKRDMPTEAWNFLAPRIRECKALGLFGAWVPHNGGSSKVGSRAKYRTDLKVAKDQARMRTDNVTTMYSRGKTGT